MAEFSRYFSRLLVGWRVMLLFCIVLDFFHLSDAAPATVPALKPLIPALTPMIALIVLAIVTLAGIALTYAVQSRDRALPLVLIDTIAALACGVAMPYSTAANLLFSLPVLDLSVLGAAAGLIGGVVFLLIFPALMIFRGTPLSHLSAFSGYLAFMVFATVTGLLISGQQRLEAQAQAVVSVIQTSQELGSSASLQKILSVVVRDIKQLFLCTGCVIYLRDLIDPESTFMTVAEADTLNRDIFIDFDRQQKKSVIGTAMEEKKVILIDDFKNYPGEQAIKSGTHIRSTMVAPLLFENESLGAILVSHYNPGFYKPAMLSLFTMLANQLGVAVRNVQLQKTTEAMAITDSLSGLYTHRYFQSTLDDELAKSKHKTRKPLSLAILDIDFFKKVNDTYGHPQGDALLRQLGDVLKHTGRPNDILCRYGGDEFVVIMPDTPHDAAAMLAERIRAATEEYEFALGRKVVHVTISGGVSTFPEDADTKMELISRADQAMYRAKQRGRNRVVRRGEGAVLFQTVGVDEQADE